MKIVEERNRLIKIRIYKQGGSQWRLLPVEKKDGSSIRKGEITFRGDEEAFRKLLMKLKAKDVETDPPSVKGKTYQQMIDTAKDGSDPYIWVWLKIWNKYRNDNRLTIAERELRLISKTTFLENYLEKFIDFYRKNRYTGVNAVLTALDDFMQINDINLVWEDFENLVALLENKYIMENKEITLEKSLKIGNYLLEKGDKIRVVNEVYHNGKRLMVKESRDIKSFTLEGSIKNKKYIIDFDSHIGSSYQVTISENHGDYVETVFSKNNLGGGTVEQLLSSAFHFLKIPVPKDDDMSRSGLNFDLMVNELKQYYNFRLVVNEVYHNVLNMDLEKYTLDSSRKKRANRMLSEISSPPYYNEIPLDLIEEALKREGIILLQEDLEEWSGLLVGRDSEASIAIGDISTSRRAEWGGIIYTPYTNSVLRISWYTMNSGKYEVVCYLT